MIRRATALALLAWSGALDAQTIHIRDAGPGPGPKLLQEELALPHSVIPPGPRRAMLPRDSTFPGSVVVLGRDAVVEGRVQGDVVVIGGDLYMHPGAAVTGRLVAVGGGVYRSALATQGGEASFREFTYDIAFSEGGYYLSYRATGTVPPRRVALAGLYGLGLPSYDRTNGLSLPAGIDLGVSGKTLQLQPRLTYRSQLGRLDASITAVDSLDRRTAVTFWAGRSTFSNEDWIWSDLVNSTEYLLVGNDARNYYRATRERFTIARKWEIASIAVTPYVGAQHEHPATARPQPGAEHSPWTFFNRNDPDDALRPNLPVETAGITSGLAGMRIDWTSGDIVARLDAAAEVGNLKSDCTACVTGPATTLAQLILNGAIDFPTFGTQTLSVGGHAVISKSGTPHERFGFVGGNGTIPTLEMLELGGNQLVFVDARYNVPIDRMNLPLVGAPTLSVREVFGGAAVDAWPTLRQAIGVRGSVGFIYAEWMVDPTHHSGRFSAGIAVGR